GEEYLKKHAPTDYPQGEQPCAYCQQPLTVAAVDLVKKYRDFTNNEITAAFQLAEGQLRAYAQTIGAVNIESLQQQLARETAGGGDVLEPVKGLLERAKQMAGDVAGRRAADWPDKDAAAAAAEAVVSAEAIRLTALAAGLQTSVTERQTALKE